MYPMERVEIAQLNWPLSSLYSHSGNCIFVSRTVREKTLNSCTFINSLNACTFIQTSRESNGQRKGVKYCTFINSWLLLNVNGQIFLLNSAIKNCID
jgi:hypothetical protein